MTMSEFEHVTRFATAEEFAEILGVSLWTAQNMCRRGEVRCTKLNNRTWRIDAREYLERKVSEMSQAIT